jgi:hypothetical protein
MKELIRNILIESTNSNPLSRVEIMLFKYINNKKKETKTKSELMDLISDTLKNMGLNPDLALFYYEMFALNYRENGDYENLTYNEFKGVKDFKAKKTPNVSAWKFTTAKMPFKGSNLEGKWSKDSKGVDYYVVTSYGWFPIFLFKEGVWYEVTRRYSSSTGRQMSNAMPVKYDDNIGRDVVLVTQDEMSKLESYATLDDITKNKFKSAIKNKESLISDKTKNISSSQWWMDDDGNQDDIGFKVKFKISDVREENGKIVVDVNIMEVNRRDGNKTVYTPENYTKGELPGVTKERVERNILRKIRSNFKDYIGKAQPWGKYIEDRSNVRFNFIHEKEK